MMRKLSVNDDRALTGGDPINKVRFERTFSFSNPNPDIPNETLDRISDYSTKLGEETSSTEVDYCINEFLTYVKLSYLAE